MKYTSNKFLSSLAKFKKEHAAITSPLVLETTDRS